MPDLGISEIIALAGLLAGGVSTGVSVYEQGKTRDAQTHANNAAKQAAAQRDLLQKRQALIAAGPNAQAQTGGSLTGPAGQSFTDLLAGLPGQTGGSAPTNPAGPTTTPTTGQPPGTLAGIPSGDALTNFIQQQQGGGNFSGGWQPPQSGGAGGKSLSDFLQGV